MTKLIAVDMDGTFLNDNKTYDKEPIIKKMVAEQEEY